TQNKINLIRFSVAVNPLILSGFQAIKVAEVFGRLKHRYLLHFFIRKANEFFDVPNFHIRVRPIVVESVPERENSVGAYYDRPYSLQSGERKDLCFGHDFFDLSDEMGV